MEYETKCFEIIDGKVAIPDGAIPFKVTLMLTGSLRDSDTKMRNGVSCLVPIKEKGGIDEQELGEGV